MSTVANIYDNGPISPIARVNEKIAAYIDTKYVPYRIKYIEGIPPSSPFVVDLCLAALQGVYTPIAANGTLTVVAPQVLQLNALEMLHLRWEPLDDVEGLLYEQGAAPRYNAYGAQARVNLFTRRYDPWLATTTFFVVGKNRDVKINAVNPRGVAQPMARFQFWGIRYILSDVEENNSPVSIDGPITLLPAQGR
jgi:hypothetical protein